MGYKNEGFGDDKDIVAHYRTRQSGRKPASLS